jgi:hypothetical protein
MQRILPVASSARIHANCEQAVIGRGEPHQPEWQLYATYCSR